MPMESKSDRTIDPVVFGYAALVAEVILLEEPPLLCCRLVVSFVSV